MSGVGVTGYSAATCGAYKTTQGRFSWCFRDSPGFSTSPSTSLMGNPTTLRRSGLQRLHLLLLRLGSVVSLHSVISNPLRGRFRNVDSSPRTRNPIHMISPAYPISTTSIIGLCTPLTKLNSHRPRSPHRPQERSLEVDVPGCDCSLHVLRIWKTQCVA